MGHGRTFGFSFLIFLRLAPTSWPLAGSSLVSEDTAVCGLHTGSNAVGLRELAEEEQLGKASDINGSGGKLAPAAGDNGGRLASACLDNCGKLTSA